jgi:hypothetical protein
MGVKRITIPPPLEGEGARGRGDLRASFQSRLQSRIFAFASWNLTPTPDPSPLQGEGRYA